MTSNSYLLDIALILLCTKVLGIITKKFHMPQVVGALLGGLLLGPAVFGIIKETSLIQQVAEIGVIVLMFTAGLETDVKELKNSGKAAFIIAMIGVIVPLIGGYFIAYLFNRPGVIESSADCSIFLQNVFIGVILTATSVSISVETLKEIGKLNTRAGNAILGAAVIDDVLGIIALTIITSMADSSINIWVVLFKIVAFFVCCIPIGFIFIRFFSKWQDMYQKDKRRFVIIAFVFCLVMAYGCENFFGIADITGAYIAGLIISNTQRTKYIASRFDTLSYMFLSPIFFASIGLKVKLPPMSLPIILFSVILVVVACLTKVIGCGIGAKVNKFSNAESIQVGIGMISRGEVALIVASKGDSLGLMSANFLGPVIIVVVATTIITPIFLKIAFKDKETTHFTDGMTESYEELMSYQTGETDK